MTVNVTDTRSTRRVDQADGVYFIGRPDWLTEELFADLRSEARDQRPGAQQIRDQHFAELGPIGSSLRSSSQLEHFVATNAAEATPSGFGNYRYYDIHNSHVDPHLDTDHFWLNVIVMLEHDFGSERRSTLLLFAHGPEKPVTLQMDPGEVILFNAKQVVHARTPISEDGDEVAVNLGIGFTPVKPIENVDFWHPEGGWTAA